MTERGDRLFYIHADTDEGEDMSLFVRLPGDGHKELAIQHWAEYYEVSGREEADIFRIGEVPTGTLGALGWDWLPL